MAGGAAPAPRQSEWNKGTGAGKSATSYVDAGAGYGDAYGFRGGASTDASLSAKMGDLSVGGQPAAAPKTGGVIMPQSDGGAAGGLGLRFGNFGAAGAAGDFGFGGGFGGAAAPAPTVPAPGASTATGAGAFANAPYGAGAGAKPAVSLPDDLKQDVGSAASAGGSAGASAGAAAAPRLPRRTARTASPACPARTTT